MDDARPLRSSHGMARSPPPGLAVALVNGAALHSQARPLEAGRPRTPVSGEAEPCRLATAGREGGTSLKHPGRVPTDGGTSRTTTWLSGAPVRRFRCSHLLAATPRVAARSGQAQNPYSGCQIRREHLLLVLLWRPPDHEPTPYPQTIS